MRTPVSLPRNGQSIQNILNLDQLFIIQRCNFAILSHTFDLRGAGDGNRALTADPSDGYLCGGDALAFGDLLHCLYEFEILIEVVGAEAGEHATPVVLW